MMCIEMSRERFNVSVGFIVGLLTLLLVISRNDFIAVFFSLAVCFYSRTKSRFISRSILKNYELVLVVILGVLAVRVSEVYGVAKDIYYFTKPLIFIMTGWALYSIGITREKFFTMCVWSSMLCALYFLASTLFHYSDYLNSSFDEYRRIVGRGYLICPIICVVFYFRSALGLGGGLIGRYHPMIFYCVVITAIFMFGSRLSFVLFFLTLASIFLCLRGFAISKLLLIVFSSIVLSSFFVFYEGVFVDKTLNSLNEIFRLEFSNFNKSQIVESWRAYESFLVINKFLSASIYQLGFGFGFGSMLELGFYFELDEYEADSIPFIHNAFLLVLMKSGLVGLFWYLMFLVRILRMGISHGSSMPFFFVAAFLVFFATSFVISGVYNSLSIMPLLVILGYMQALKYDDKNWLE